MILTSLYLLCCPCELWAPELLRQLRGFPRYNESHDRDSRGFVDGPLVNVESSRLMQASKGAELLHGCNMYDTLMMVPRQPLPLLSGNSVPRTGLMVKVYYYYCKGFRCQFRANLDDFLDSLKSAISPYSPYR